MLASSRKLGEAREPDQVRRRVAMIERETHFNAMNPFWQAPIAYGAALALLAVSLGFVAGPKNADRAARPGPIPGRACWRWRRASPWRSTASPCGSGSPGWAPVTNMYETVIWVALVAAVLSFVFELIYRRTFTGAGRLGRGPAGDDHGGERAAAGPEHPQPDTRPAEQLLADDPRAHRGLQLRRVRPGMGAGADRDGLLPDGHLPPLAAIRRAGIAAGARASCSWRSGRRESPRPTAPSATQWTTGDALFYVFAILGGLGGMISLAAVLAIGGELVNRLVYRRTLQRADAAFLQETERARRRAGRLPVLASAASAAFEEEAAWPR